MFKVEVEGFSKKELQHYYMNSMRPVLDKNALYSDTTEEYLIPSEPNPYTEVIIRFRAAKNNVDNVFFCCNGQREMMLKSYSDDNFDFYEVEYQLDDEKITYHFEVKAGKLTCYFDMRGVAKTADNIYNFVVIPGFKTPKWAKGAVIYQIYVDRFCNGDPTNDVLTNEYVYINNKTVKVEDWYQYPASMDVRNFYGGDLQGVIDKLDYLHDLGIDAIYFNPLFVSPSNHKYDIQDYDNIDPHIGKIVSDKGELLKEEQWENKEATRYINRVTNPENLKASNQLFIQLVEEAHKRGIKVIIDGVFNHCGSFNKWIDRERIYEDVEGYEKGAHISKDSPYRKYFQFYDETKWPYNTTYDGWWGHDTLPKLNYEESRELYEYILYIGKKWVSAPYNADGWRLDVAADLGHTPEFNHKFWKDFRKEVKMANPNAIILAEHYGDPSSWLQGDQWDTVMNYDAFMEPITWFLTGMQKHSDDFRADMLGNAVNFWGAMQYHMTHFANPSLQVAMNELSNHDHSRFLTRTNRVVGRTNNLGPEAANQGVNKAVLREAVVFQMTWPGAPTIYYGDEAGVCGFTDPDNRRTYPWGREDKDLIEFHKSIIRIHKENQEFLDGSLKFMISEHNILGYGRMRKGEASLVVINNSEETIIKDIPVWYLGVPTECIMHQLMMTTENGYNDQIEEVMVIAGRIQIMLPKTSAVILKYRKNRGKKFLQFE